MYLTGFADEAADSLDGQIAATKQLGWKCIEARLIDNVSIHDMDETAFDSACGTLQDAGVSINCIGSTIANWSRSVLEDFDQTMAAVTRCIDRMQRLDAKLVRIMSYQVLMDKEGRALEDQMEPERFRRLSEICRRFTDAGITPVHENCLGYGGMSWQYALRMIENVPGMKLVFDTGNPPTTPDFSQPFPYPRQSSWEFYTHVRDHIAYVHIKDARWDPATGQELFFFPGDGDGDVERIVADLLKTGYDGGFSMEPHMLVVFHHGASAADANIRMNNYIEYGRKFMAMMDRLGHPLQS